MSHQRNGPPESEAAAPATETATRQNHADADNDNPEADKNRYVRREVPCPRLPAPQDTPSQLRRRREASRRLPPLPHSGRRDPISRVTG
jgi:hypothetical protein